MKAALFTREGRAATAAARWYEQRTGKGQWLYNHEQGRDAAIHAALLALGESPSPEDVNRVIGNGSWVDLSCDACDASTDVAVQVGQEPDYESSTAMICPACLAEAAALVTTSAPPGKL